MGRKGEETTSGQPIEKVRAAQRKAEAQFARHDEVNGIGITRVGEGFGLKVNLTRPLKSGSTLPEQIDDVPVQVEVVGPIRAR